MASTLITITPTATVESTATFTSEYQSTHRSTISQIFTTATEVILESTATFTTIWQSTYLATLGGTITITPPPIYWSLQPPETASPTTHPDATVTVTEVAITIVQPDSTSVSTLTLPMTTSYATAFPPIQPSPYVIVVGSDHYNHGWDSWSSGQKGGMIAGVILAFLLMLACLLLWRSSRKRTWIANDWSVNSHPAWGTNQPGQMVPQGYAGRGLRGGSGGVGHGKRVKTLGTNGRYQNERSQIDGRDTELRGLCVME